MHIVAIDDDLDLLQLLQDALGDAGWTVTGCSVGSEALASIRREQPDVVVLDLWLQAPGEGWQILDTLHADPALSGIPIIICSAAIHEVRGREGFLQNSAVRFVAKPFDIDALEAALTAAAAAIT